MHWPDAALAMAGVLGSGTTVGHGVLLQRFVVRPLDKLLVGDERTTASIRRRLVPALLHFSTISWFLGGLALVAAATVFGREARIATGLLVGTSYLLAVLINFWATRGRHFGWMLYAAAVILIAIGLRPSDV
jgi:hypothetical protein